MKMTSQQKKIVEQYINVPAELSRDIYPQKREDCLGYLNLALCNAVMSYKKEAGMSMRSWIYLKLKYAKQDWFRSIDYLTQAERRKDVMPKRSILSFSNVYPDEELSFEEVYGDEDSSYERFLDIDEAKQQAQKIKNLFSERNFNILYQNCCENLSAEEIAKLHKISIRRIEALLSKMKHKARNAFE